MTTTPSDVELKPWYRADAFGPGLVLEYDIREQISDGIPDIESARYESIARCKSRDRAEQICAEHNRRLSDARGAVIAECAKVADQLESEWRIAWRAGHKSDSHLEGKMDGAGDVANLIRALSHPQPESEKE